MDNQQDLLSNRLRAYAGAVLAALCVLAVGAAQAGSLSVVNASFELPALGACRT